MNRLHIGLLGLLVLVPAIGDAASSAELSLDRADHDVIVRKGAAPAFTIPVGNKDEAFLAASCVIVRRNVRSTELFPDVDSLEIYQPNGKRRVYSKDDLGIRRLDQVRIFNSPDKNWAVIPDEEEGQVSGVFLISSACSIKEVVFPNDAPIYWKTLSGKFLGDKTLLLPSMEFEDRQGQRQKIEIQIHQDGTYRITRG